MIEWLAVARTDGEILKTDTNSKYTDAVDGLIFRNVRDDQDRILGKHKPANVSFTGRIGVVYFRP